MLTLGSVPGPWAQDSATRSYIGAGTTVNAFSVTLDADANVSAEAITDGGSGAGIADISITNIVATNKHDTEAYVGDGAILNLDGALIIDAKSTLTANPYSDSLSIAGVVSYGETDIKTVLDGDTNAYIGDQVDIDVDSIVMSAHATHNATANISQGGGALVARRFGACDA